MPTNKPDPEILEKIKKFLAEYCEKNGIPPIAVAANMMEKIHYGRSNKTFANDRSLKKGIKYYLVDGKPVYLFSDIIEHYTRNPVQTFND